MTSAMSKENVFRCNFECIANRTSSVLLMLRRMWRTRQICRYSDSESTWTGYLWCNSIKIRLLLGLLWGKIKEVLSRWKWNISAESAFYASRPLAHRHSAHRMNVKRKRTSQRSMKVVGLWNSGNRLNQNAPNIVVFSLKRTSENVYPLISVVGEMGFSYRAHSAHCSSDEHVCGHGWYRDVDALIALLFPFWSLVEYNVFSIYYFPFHRVSSSANSFVFITTADQ